MRGDRLDVHIAVLDSDPNKDAYIGSTNRDLGPWIVFPTTYLTQFPSPARRRPCHVAQLERTVALSVVDALADRLADDDESHYVRARCVEAL